MGGEKEAIENSRRKRGSESSAVALFAKVSRRHRVVSPVRIIIANADLPFVKKWSGENTARAA